MNFLSLFSKKAPNLVFISILLGAVSGVLYSAIIPLVLSSVQPEDNNFESIKQISDTFLTIEVANYKLAGIFFTVCILILILRSISEIVLVRIAAHIAKDLRMQFYNTVAGASLSGVEKIGSSKLIASINIDIPNIILGARVFPALLINGITLFGMLSFLMYLNFDIFKLVISAIVIGIICYQLPMIFAKQMLVHSREIRDDLQESFKGLIFGAKELKLDTLKRKNYFENVLVNNENDLLKMDKKAQTVLISTTSFGDLISFFVIGFVCFIFVNYYSINSQELIGVVMALLYVTGPIAIIMGQIPQILIASISHKKFQKLLTQISSENCLSDLSAVSDWKSFKFNDVQFSYSSTSDESNFKIGPINLEIKKGEVTFIVGGNGSGKSTLSKVLTLHYQPTSGNIVYGAENIISENITRYRQNIAAIYSDFYLFDRLLVPLTDDLLALANQYLKMLNLDKKVHLIDGQFSTLNLSDGQRKRLALLVALLEDKQIYLFDEWAADQDPIFKNVFYNEILPELKSRNKAIIVISHDDRYFYVADQILEMEQGKLVTKMTETPSVKINKLTA